MFGVLNLVIDTSLPSRKCFLLTSSSSYEWCAAKPNYMSDLPSLELTFDKLLLGLLASLNVAKSPVLFICLGELELPLNEFRGKAWYGLALEFFV